MHLFAVAPNGIYWNIQGEGHLRGQQMAFLRLSGCGIKCPACDTDYSTDRKETALDIANEIDTLIPQGIRDLWVWVTGGEPYDRDLRELLRVFRERRFSVAVATSGIHRAIEPVDWLSVSPHGGASLIQRFGSEIKLVEGLNGLDLDKWIEKNPDSSNDFFFRYCQPLSNRNSNGTYSEDAESLRRCMKFLESHPNWCLSRQDHHKWRIT